MAAPKIRFKGFTDAWLQRKLGEITEQFEYGLNASAKNFDGIHKYIRITDIDEDSRYFDERNITSPDIDFTDADNYLLKRRDILFARTGASVGKTYIHNDDVAAVYFAGFLIRGRFFDEHVPEFIYQNTLTQKFNTFIKVMSQRSGQPGVNAQEYASYLLGMPSKSEQTAIGNFFRTLDDTIALHKLKLDGLKKLKKGYLQQMFPQSGESMPRVRFAGFCEDWMQRKITGVAKVFIGLVTTMTENYRSEGTLLIRNSDIKEGRFEFAENPIHLDEEFAEENTTRRLFIGDVVTVHTGDIGTSAVIGERENGAIGFATINTRPNTKILDSNFLATFFNTDVHKEWAIKMSTGDGRSNYNLKDFNQLQVPVPHIDEQTAIGKFFRNIDAQIITQQTKLDKLKQLKAAYLKQMFV